MSENGNLDALIERVLTKARDEAAALTARAEKALERAVRQAEQQTRQRLTAAASAVREAAVQRKHSILAETQQEERRRLMNIREEAVEAVFDAALDALADPRDKPARCALLVKLVGEGVRALGVDAVRVQLNDAERALVCQGEWPGEIEGAAVTIDNESIASRGGPVVSDASGRVVYENTFEARLARKRDELRGQVAHILELV